MSVARQIGNGFRLRALAQRQPVHVRHHADARRVIQRAAVSGKMRTPSPTAARLRQFHRRAAVLRVHADKAVRIGNPICALKDNAFAVAAPARKQRPRSAGHAGNRSRPARGEIVNAHFAFAVQVRNERELFAIGRKRRFKLISVFFDQPFGLAAIHRLFPQHPGGHENQRATIGRNSRRQHGADGDSRTRCGNPFFDGARGGFHFDASVPDDLFARAAGQIDAPEFGVRSGVKCLAVRSDVHSRACAREGSDDFCFPFAEVVLPQIAAADEIKAVSFGGQGDCANRSRNRAEARHRAISSNRINRGFAACRWWRSRTRHLRRRRIEPGQPAICQIENRAEGSRFSQTPRFAARRRNRRKPAHHRAATAKARRATCRIFFAPQIRNIGDGLAVGTPHRRAGLIIARELRNPAARQLHHEDVAVAAVAV
ncbi:MAG: hypothetical protein JMDDDDMK_03822 [Acidobacteria bacterium]|nr:hypothetical protein [Acidobacteriota bacterium]